MFLDLRRFDDQASPNFALGGQSVHVEDLQIDMRRAGGSMLVLSAKKSTKAYALIARRASKSIPYQDNSTSHLNSLPEESNFCRTFFRG